MIKFMFAVNNTLPLHTTHNRAILANACTARLMMNVVMLRGIGVHNCLWVRVHMINYISWKMCVAGCRYVLEQS